MNTVKRIALHFSLGLLQLVFSLVSAVALSVAAFGMSDLPDAPGDGILILGALLWALLGAFIAIFVAGSHFAIGGGTYGSILAQSVLLLLASNALAACGVCLMSVHEKNGWLFSAILIATGAFAIWLCVRVTSDNWWLYASTAVGVPLILVAGCICYADVSSGKNIVEARNPSGSTMAQVNRTGTGDCVLLSGGLNPWRTCVFQSRGVAIQLRWVDARNLRVICCDCGKYPDQVDPGREFRWRGVAIQYEFCQ
jgi:hypothetical protein